MVAPLRRDRPDIPESYGISTEEDGLLEWEDVSSSLAAASTYWVATSRANGLPHLIPIWGGWAHERLHIEGGDDTLWHRNLTRSDAVSVGADHEGMQMIIYGKAHLGPVEDHTAVADNFAGKYPYRPDPRDMWIISPHRVLAWSTATMDTFGTTPTRFWLEDA